MKHLNGCPTVLIITLSIFDKFISFMETVKYKEIFTNKNMIIMEKYLPYYKATGNALEDANKVNF